MTDRRNLTPADEPGMLREEMRRLKAREAELRAEMIEAGGAAPGTRFRVEIVEQSRRTFDRAALPAEIDEDPRYWKVSTARMVRTLPLAGGADALIDEDDV